MARGLSVPQAMEGIDHFLSSLHGEGGDDQFPASRIGLGHRLGQFFLHLIDVFVEAVPVGALCDQVVQVFYQNGVAQDREVFAPQVAREAEADPPPMVVNLQDSDRGAQDVARIAEECPHTSGDGKPPVVLVGHEIVQRVLGFLDRVQRLHRRQALATMLLVDVFHVLVVDVGAVPEHDGGQVGGGHGAVDVSTEAAFDQGRDVATVVYVGMREDHGIDALGVEGQVAVPLEGLSAMTLEESAIQKQKFAIDVNEVLRTRHPSGRTPEGDLH
jgi:hypothetical protein